MKNTFLTSEEKEVLILAAPHPCGQYRDNAEIGKCLGISMNRVKSLLHHTCNKLKAHNRIEAIQCALRRRYIYVDELWSLDEIADLSQALCPDILRKITFLAGEEMGHRYYPIKDKYIFHLDKERDDILTLTKSERRVLTLAGRGLTNKEIADTLFISVNAVRTSLYRTYSKLSADKRGDAVTIALKRGEISPSELFSFYELLHFFAPLGTDSLKEIARLMNLKLRTEIVYESGYR